MNINERIVRELGVTVWRAIMAEEAAERAGEQLALAQANDELANDELAKDTDNESERPVSK